MRFATRALGTSGGYVAGFWCGMGCAAILAASATVYEQFHHVRGLIRAKG